MRRVAFLCWLLFCWCACSGPGEAASSRAPALSAGSGPSGTMLTRISSETMAYDAAARQITFAGRVKVNHPDFDLTSDQLRLFLNEAEAGGASPLNVGAVRGIEAEVEVEIRLADGKVAHCSKAIYETVEETLILEGNPVLREGLNQVRGDRMIFYLREDRHEVQGRVTVDFISSGSSSDGRRASPGGLKP